VEELGYEKYHGGDRMPFDETAIRLAITLP